jgi:aryl-alcohol dehydrogenase-like predicted oxidoreductase
MAGRLQTIERKNTPMSTPLTRRLGANEIPAIGMGCWAIGGPFWFGSQPLGWGEVDDKESVAAIHKALDLGIKLFDTANIYGCGHSERVLARALKGVREQVLVATKFGNTFNESTRQKIGQDASPEGIRRACDESLQRLDTTYIDLYQFHLNDYDPLQAVEVRETLEELVADGKIHSYGWSTDFPERAAVFAEGKHNVAVQHELSVFFAAPEMVQFCEERGLASVNRSPLAMGLLTGKFDASSRLNNDDVRGLQPVWLRYFDKGQAKPEWLGRLDAIRKLLGSDGRTLTQGALAWIWARSPQTIPIPGFRTIKQVEENIAALRFGSLSQTAVQQIAGLLATE